MCVYVCVCACVGNEVWSVKMSSLFEGCNIHKYWKPRLLNEQKKSLNMKYVFKWKNL